MSSYDIGHDQREEDRYVYFADRIKDEQAEKRHDDLKTLMVKWTRLTGQAMPLEIAAMSLPQIRRKLDLVKAAGPNVVYGVPRGAVPMAEQPEESMMDWDNHDNKLGS